MDRERRTGEPVPDDRLDQVLDHEDHGEQDQRVAEPSRPQRDEEAEGPREDRAEVRDVGGDERDQCDGQREREVEDDHGGADQHGGEETRRGESGESETQHTDRVVEDARAHVGRYSQVAADPVPQTRPVDQDVEEHERGEEHREADRHDAAEDRADVGGDPGHGESLEIGELVHLVVGAAEVQLTSLQPVVESVETPRHDARDLRALVEDPPGRHENRDDDHCRQRCHHDQRSRPPWQAHALEAVDDRDGERPDHDGDDEGDEKARHRGCDPEHDRTERDDPDQHPTQRTEAVDPRPGFDRDRLGDDSHGGSPSTTATSVAHADS